MHHTEPSDRQTVTGRPCERCGKTMLQVLSDGLGLQQRGAGLGSQPETGLGGGGGGSTRS